MRGDALEGGKVYIVDDDAAVRDSLTVLLETYELEVEAYESLGAFTRGYRPHPRACLILDHHMPNVTGLEFLASPEGHALSLPAILITGQNDREIRAQAIEIGVIAFLPKPIASDALIAAIGSALDGKAQARRGAS